MKLQEPFLELLIGLLSRQVLHDVEDQLDGFLMQAVEGVAVLLKTVPAPL